MTIQSKITFESKSEKARIIRLARKAGLSLSNYVRGRLGLPRLRHGGRRKQTAEAKA